MNQETRDEIVNDLLGALDFVGQAQGRAPHLSELWHVLGKLYDRLDEEQSIVQAREVNDEGIYV